MFTCRIDDDLELRLPEESNAEVFFEHIQKNKNYLMEWFRMIDWGDSVEGTRDRIKQFRRAYCENGDVVAFTYMKYELCGVIWTAHTDKSNKSTDIGYWVGKEHQGKGIVTRSCKALLRFLFQKSEINRVQLRCVPKNERSKQMADRLGFTFEGTLRDAVWFRDHFEDFHCYSLLASEWSDQA